MSLILFQVFLSVLSIICCMWCPEVLTISQCLVKCRVYFFKTQLAQTLILDGKSKLPHCWFTHRPVMATISIILCLLRRKKKEAGSCFSSQGRNINLTGNQTSLQVSCRGQSRGELFLSCKIPLLWSELRYMRRQGHCIQRFQSLTTLETDEELRSWSNFTEG